MRSVRVSPFIGFGSSGRDVSVFSTRNYPQPADLATSHTPSHAQQEPPGSGAELSAGLTRPPTANSGLTGIELFEEGLAILRRFVADEGVLDHRDVLAIEKEFRLQVGGFEVLGFIDRVNRTEDDGVEVVDYKSNRQIFSRDEVDTSLQLSLYAAAAKQLWPWAKHVRLTFHMLRHGLRLQTERTEEQLQAALEYTTSLGQATERAREFPPRLNTNCVWCDHKLQCPAYAAALQGKRDFICEDKTDLEAVAREREEVARIAKVLGARKTELEGVLKAHLANEDELLLAGVRYRMFNTSKHDYPLDTTLGVLGQATGLDREQLLGRVCAVDGKRLDDLLKSLRPTLGGPHVAMLKAEIEAAADTSYSPRFWAKAVKP